MLPSPPKITVGMVPAAERWKAKWHVGGGEPSDLSAALIGGRERGLALAGRASSRQNSALL
jgi:hypothetical protein